MTCVVNLFVDSQAREDFINQLPREHEIGKGDLKFS